jgi:hypothetical protein
MITKTNLRRSLPWGLVIVLTVITAAVIFIANKQYHQKLAFIAQADSERIMMEKEVNAIFDTIELNLERISQYENRIRDNFPGTVTEMVPSQKERIQQEIREIEQLLNANNALIESLNEQLKEKNAKLSKNEATITELKKRTEEYRLIVDALFAEKEDLQKQLDRILLKNQQLETAVGDLNETLTTKETIILQKDQELTEKSNELNTAYYSVGTYKALKDKGILEKEGGFLGINQVKILVSPLDPSEFTRIDIRNLTEIPVMASRCEIVTGQEPSSYELVINNDIVEMVRITDPGKFWDITKYLVIVVREDHSEELTVSR